MVLARKKKPDKVIHSTKNSHKRLSFGETPQIVVMQTQINTLQAQMTTMQAQIVVLQANHAQMDANIKAIMAYLGIPPVVLPLKPK